MKNFLFVLICLCLVGCATATKMNSLSLGMAKSEVISKIGNPHTTKAVGNQETLEYWLYPTANHYWANNSQPYWIILQDGRVVQYGKAGDFGTALPEDRREYIIKNR